MQAIPFVNNPNKKNINQTILSNPDKFIQDKLKGSRFAFGIENIRRSGFYREMGYLYDFRPFLKRFVYKQYESWNEAYALNKTNLRCLISGKINKIVEI